jgi:hypothetical protein
MGKDVTASIPTDAGEVEATIPTNAGEVEATKAVCPTLFESTFDSGKLGADILDSGEVKHTRTGRQSKASQKSSFGFMSALLKLLIAPYWFARMSCLSAAEVCKLNEITAMDTFNEAGDGDGCHVVIDPSYRNNSLFDDESPVDMQHWKEFSPDAKEALPPDMPKSFEKKARRTAYVDADHASDKVTRRSVTGIIVFLNNTLVHTFLEGQKTVAASTYVAAMVAARIATDIPLKIRHSLRKMGVPLDGPALMIGDDQSVIINSTVPSLVLRKKHLSCGCHRVRECIAARILRFVYVYSTKNVADVQMKNLDSTAFHWLVDPVLWKKPLSKRN